MNTSVPHKVLKLFAKYRFGDGPLRGISLGGGVNWEGEVYGMQTSPSGIRERVANAAFTVVNLMASYDVTPSVSLQAHLNNVLDKKYYANDLAYFDNLFYGEPRKVTVALKYKF